MSTTIVIGRICLSKRDGGRCRCLLVRGDGDGRTWLNATERNTIPFHDDRTNNTTVVNIEDKEGLIIMNNSFGGDE